MQNFDNFYCFRIFNFCRAVLYDVIKNGNNFKNTKNKIQSFSLRYTGSKIVEPLESRLFYVTLNGYISMKKCRIEKNKPSFTHNCSSRI